jgi:septal ring factor EnvC (AmiA/AmiB activator)
VENTQTVLAGGGLIALLTLIGGAVGWVVKILIDRSRENRTNRKQDEEVMINRLSKLLEQERQEREGERAETKREIGTLRTDLDRMRTLLTELTARNTENRARIRYLESLLKKEGIEFVSWDDVPPPGSASHPALGEGPK